MTGRASEGTANGDTDRSVSRWLALRATVPRPASCTRAAGPLGVSTSAGPVPPGLGLDVRPHIPDVRARGPHDRTAAPDGGHGARGRPAHPGVGDLLRLGPRRRMDPQPA